MKQLLFNIKGYAVIIVTLAAVYACFFLFAQNRGDDIAELMTKDNAFIFLIGLGFLLFFVITYILRRLSRKMGSESVLGDSGKIDLRNWKFQLGYFSIFCILIAATFKWSPKRQLIAPVFIGVHVILLTFVLYRLWKKSRNKRME